MSKRILFVENNEMFLRERKNFLEQEGYQVIPAMSPSEGRRAVDQHRIDLVIVDIRLIDEADEKDISGLTFAKETTSLIPIIILTRYGTYDAVREAYGPNLDGLPSAVDFVAKQDGTEAMLRAVHRAFRVGSRFFRASQDEIREQLNKDHQEARAEAKAQYRASLTISILCTLVILAGITLSLSNKVTAGIVSSAAGVFVQVVTYLLFRRVDLAHRRVDRFNEELLQTRRVETLLAASEELSSDEKKDIIIMEVIHSAARGWLGSRASRLRDARPPTGRRSRREKEQPE